jgi:hypothetical protein
LIDEGQLKRSTMDQTTDDKGKLLAGSKLTSQGSDGQLSWLLVVMMTACQHIDSDLGSILVIASPTFHAELAGEGIE